MKSTYKFIATIKVCDIIYHNYDAAKDTTYEENY